MSLPPQGIWSEVAQAGDAGAFLERTEKSCVRIAAGRACDPTRSRVPVPPGTSGGAFKRPPQKSSAGGTRRDPGVYTQTRERGARVVVDGKPFGPGAHHCRIAKHER